MQEKMTRRQCKKILSKRAIIAAAKKLFAAQGVAETSIADIMKEANLGLGTFYNYFESKEALLKELLNLLAQELRQKVVEIANTDKSAGQVLKAVVLETAKLLDQNRFVLPLFIKAADKSALPHHLADEGAEPAPLFKYIFDGIIKRGQEQGEFRDDIPFGIITEMFHSIFQAAAFSSLPIPFVDNIRDKFSLIFNGLKKN